MGEVISRYACSKLASISFACGDASNSLTAVSTTSRSFRRRSVRTAGRSVGGKRSGTRKSFADGSAFSTNGIVLLAEKPGFLPVRQIAAGRAHLLGQDDDAAAGRSCGL